MTIRQLTAFAPLALVPILFVGSATAQVTTRVSVDSLGNQAGSPVSPTTTALSHDGRFVAFDSAAQTLVANDSNGSRDVFVRNRRTGVTERVSVPTGGLQADGDSYLVSMSENCRFVTFGSRATNLVSGDTNGEPDYFLRDRWAGTTERVSLTTTGGQGNGYATDGGGTSEDGRFAVFISDADNLVPGDTNDMEDVFVRDRLMGTTERVSVSTMGAQGIWDWAWDAYSCKISADGRFVAFVSALGGLVPDDTNTVPDVFVRDRLANVTERVSVSSTGDQQIYDFIDFLGNCCISADGRFVGFSTPASNLVQGDSNDWFDGFVHDRVTGQTRLVTRGNEGLQAQYYGGWIRDFSGNGGLALFQAGADVQSDGPPNRVDTFIQDLASGSTRRMSVGASGEPALLHSTSISISSDGRHVAFATQDGLVPDDTNDMIDVFVRDRFGGPSFESLCRPGTDGVTNCPCDNPPADGERGCDNGARTGGAVLSAEGATILSSDSLVFTATHQAPSGVSILTAWSSLGVSGRTFGHGVLCTDGPFRRLYTASVQGGVMTTPDFAVGDKTVSSRSAELGDPIQPGERRWYVALYRDPGTPSACTQAADLNATQAGEVVWSP